MSTALRFPPLPSSLRALTTGLALCAGAVLAKAQTTPPARSPVYAPLFDFSAGIGVGQGVPLGLEFRFNPTSRLALALGAHTSDWRGDVDLGRIDATVRSAGAELRGRPAAYLDARYYTRADRTGWYFGAGLGRQGYRVEADSRLVPLPREPRAPRGSSGNLGIDLLAALLSIGADREPSDRRDVTSTGAVTTLRGELGYSIYAGQDVRVELGVGLRARGVGSRTFDVGTREGAVAQRLSRFDGTTGVASVRIVMGL